MGDNGGTAAADMTTGFTVRSSSSSSAGNASASIHTTSPPPLNPTTGFNTSNTVSDTKAELSQPASPPLLSSSHPVAGEGSTCSSASTPEPDADAEAERDLGPEGEAYSHELPLAQKKKGGRKPIYATSEERKQRNRQAQAAFRERRTEYIKQLETTIKHHEETLQTLQHSHRSAADECLMLRYKNSLLERILLEKGIDVQAELRARTGSPHLGPTHLPPPASAPVVQPSMQRTVFNRHTPSRRSFGEVYPKTESAHGMQRARPDRIMTSPSVSQRTPLSQNSSPATASSIKSPTFVAPHGALASPIASPVTHAHPQHQQQQQQLRPLQQARPQFGPTQAQQQQQQQHIQPPPTQMPHPSQMRTHSGQVAGTSTAASGSRNAHVNTATGPSSNYYPSPFQNHIDQLEQEYEAQADMLDDQQDHTGDPSIAAGAYAHNPFGQQIPPNTVAHGLSPQPSQPQAQQHLHPQQQHPGQQVPFQPPPSSGAPLDGIAAVAYGGVNQHFDPFDPMLDADPFGLSASMHFPTQFSYESR